MAGEWRSSTWGEEISLEYGKALRGYSEARGQYQVFGSNGPIGWTSHPLTQGPGVILGRKGAYRRVHYSPDPFFVIDTAYFVVPRKQFDMRWLYYAIKHYKLGEIDDGSPVPSTTRAAVYMISLKVPPLAEQRAIAGILGSLDDKIEANRRMNETLEAMARAIFKSWFIEPANDGLPKDWRESTIGEEVRVVGGSTPSTGKPEYWEGGSVWWATPKDLSTLRSPVLLETERRITELGLAEIGSGLLPAGTVILSSRAPIGYLAISEVPVAVNQGFIAMVCDKTLPPIYAWLWAEHFMETIKGRANGTTFQEISKANFRPIPIMVPTSALIDRFITIVNPLHRRIVKNLRESTALATIRDALLPRLISGQIRLKNYV